MQRLWLMAWKKMETMAAAAAKTARKAPAQIKHGIKLPAMTALPSQTAGGYTFSRVPIMTEDNSLSISGVMVSSIIESLEEPYMINRTKRTDRAAAVRLLCFILEEMPIITAPIRMEAVMGTRGRISMLRAPRI